MLSFLNRLFGSEKALSNVVESVTKGLDALVYTDEEKANQASKERSEARQMIVQWMAATQGQNIARRLIALSITFVWLSLYVLSTSLALSAVFFNAEKMTEIQTMSNIAKLAANDMNPAVMLILAFYFAAPHLGEIVKHINQKKV